MMNCSLLFIVYYLLVSAVWCKFQVPLPTVEVFKPHGFRVSIPDIPGIRLFAFHGNINEPINGREAGSFSRDITQTTNGRWAFVEKHARFNIGDILYYWVYVEFFDGQRVLGYPLDNLVFTVTDFKHVRELVSNNINKMITIRPIVSIEPNDFNGVILNNRNRGDNTSIRNPNLIHNNIGTFIAEEEEEEEEESKTKCETSETVVNGVKKCRGELLFEDNFDGNSLRSHWSPQITFPTSPDYEFCIYTDDTRNLYVEKSMLNIKPTLTEDTYGDNFLRTELNLGRKCTGLKGTPSCHHKAFAYNILPPVLSSKVNSRSNFSFLYGRVEVRAKLPKGDWIYPELFLDSKNLDYGPAYNSGQLRIAFAAGNRLFGDRLSGGAILGSSEKLRKHAIKSTELNTELWSDDFHTYVIEWKPRKINLLVDNKVYGSIIAPVGGFASVADKDAASIWKESLSPIVPFDKEMYLTLGVGVAGHNFFDDEVSKDEKFWKNTDPKGMLNFWLNKNKWFDTWTNDSRLQVDYVKVFAL